MKQTETYLHPTADVQSSKIGDGTVIWQYCVVLPEAQIGKNCNINCHCFVENDVSIGDNVTVKSGVSLWDGVRIGNDVFIGPNVSFINDKFPRSKQYQNNVLQTVIEDGASIGAGAIIMGGITIGKSAMIGAGSLVTKSVPANCICYGSPAKVVRNNIMDNELVDLGKTGAKTIFDTRGNLSVIEGNRDVPFAIKRVFYIWNNKESYPRGGHAHREQFQSFVAVHGDCRLKLTDDKGTREVMLDAPNQYITVPPGFWVDIDNFSADCVLLVLTSDYYDEDDYIRDFDEYLSYVQS